MSLRRTCEKCGLELPPGSSSWLCPQCLLAGAVAEESRTAGTLLSPGEPEMPPAGAAAEAPPRTLGDYQLLERIGEGGMGVVYKARQARLERIVAVKVLRITQLTNKEYLHRFRTEAVTAGSLRHPNIVAVHEVGLDDGQHYLVMDYVAGQTLAEMVRGGPLPARRAARYAQLIAQAVQFAHEHNVLHRDLKPSNVLLDADDQPHVTDFGLAKRLESGVDLTVSGQVLGSPGYLPPEQASGQRGRIGRRSDVYALGAILYHLLTGRPPFVGLEVADALRRVLNEEPVSPRLLNPSTPLDLETICLKCLEKEPGARYPTAQALAEELGRYLRDEPILSRPVGRAQKLWRWCRRKPALAGLGAAVVALLVVLGIGGPIVATQQRALAERNRRLLYASDLKVAYQTWELANMPRMVEVLERHRPEAGQTDLREFSWYYLRGLCEPYLKTPTLTHRSPIFMLSVSRDGQWLAASGSGGWVTIWEAANPTASRGIDTTGRYATPTAISPDNGLLASLIGPLDGPCQLGVWDIASGACLSRKETSLGMTVDFSPDGTTLAGAQGTNVVLLDAHAWTPIRTYEGHTGRIWQVRFAPDGRRVASCAADRTVRLWDVDTGRSIQTLSGHQEVVCGVAFAPDSRRLVSASEDKTVRLWDVASGQELGRYTHDSHVWSVDFSPDGSLVASASHDGLVKVWNPATGQIQALRGHSQTVRAIRFIPGGSRLVSGSTDGTVKLWDLAGLGIQTDTLQGKGAVRSWAGGMARPPLAFLSGGSQVLTVSSNDNALLRWQTASGALQRRWRLNHESLLQPTETPDGSNVSIVELAVSPRDDLCAVACELSTTSPGGTHRSSHFVGLWNLATDRRIGGFPGRIPVCFSPDGVWLATGGSEARTLQVTNLIDGRGWAATLEAGQDRLDAVAFCPDGRLLAVACECELVLLETASGRHLSTLTHWGTDTPINALAFTPDGQTLVVGRFNPEVELWDVRSRKLRDKWPGHLAQIMSVAISPDGKTLATGCQNGTVKLWSLELRRELLHLQAHTLGVYSLAFSPDGRVLASGGREGVVRLWRTAPREQ